MVSKAVQFRGTRQSGNTKLCTGLTNLCIGKKMSILTNIYMIIVVALLFL